MPPIQSDFANYLLKDPYIFDFVQAKQKADERNIEEQLTKQITKFLLELGQGFAFIGRQVKFEIGNQDFFTDWNGNSVIYSGDEGKSGYGYYYITKEEIMKAFNGG